MVVFIFFFCGGPGECFAQLHFWLEIKWKKQQKCTTSDLERQNFAAVPLVSYQDNDHLEHRLIREHIFSHSTQVIFLETWELQQTDDVTASSSLTWMECLHFFFLKNTTSSEQSEREAESWTWKVFHDGWLPRRRHTDPPERDLRPVRSDGSLRPDGDVPLGDVRRAGPHLPLPHRECSQHLRATARQHGSLCWRWQDPFLIKHSYKPPPTPLFPPQNALNSYCFLFFACVCLLGCVFTFSILPETKGKTLMEISAEFRAISVCGISFSEQQSTEGTKL